MYALFGDSDFTARLAPALMGTAMVAMPYFLRRQLGRVAAFTAAVLLAFGPSYLYFSRFAREDIYFAAISFALLVVVFRFLDEPKRWQPGADRRADRARLRDQGDDVHHRLRGVHVLRPAVHAARAAAGETWATIRSVGWEAWVWALAAFAIVFTLLFTVFLTNPGGLWDGLYDSIAYWLGQHDVGRGGEKPYFYVVVLFSTEWPVLLLGLVGAVFAFRQPTVLRAFLVWAFALSLAIYSWAGEKFSWLVLHPLLPLILLAGLGVQWLWESRAHDARQGRARARRAWSRSTCRWRRGWPTSSTAPTRASSSSPRSPRRRSRRSPTRCVAMAKKNRRTCRSRSTPPTARRSPTPGTSATSTSATSTSAPPARRRSPTC